MKHSILYIPIRDTVHVVSYQKKLLIIFYFIIKVGPLLLEDKAIVKSNIIYPGTQSYFNMRSFKYMPVVFVD